MIYPLRHDANVLALPPCAVPFARCAFLGEGSSPKIKCPLNVKDLNIKMKAVQV
jgi:hypothetical protein